MVTEGVTLQQTLNLCSIVSVDLSHKRCPKPHEALPSAPNPTGRCTKPHGALLQTPLGAAPNPRGAALNPRDVALNPMGRCPKPLGALP